MPSSCRWTSVMDSTCPAFRHSNERRSRSERLSIVRSSQQRGGQCCSSSKTRTGLTLHERASARNSFPHPSGTDLRGGHPSAGMVSGLGGRPLARHGPHDRTSDQAADARTDRIGARRRVRSTRRQDRGTDRRGPPLRRGTDAIDPRKRQGRLRRHPYPGQPARLPHGAARSPACALEGGRADRLRDRPESIAACWRKSSRSTAPCSTARCASSWRLSSW